MESPVITITQHDDHVWLVECPCGFFAYRGTKRAKLYESMFTARREAKRHNKISHRDNYKVSTEGSELF